MFAPSRTPQRPPLRLRFPWHAPISKDRRTSSRALATSLTTTVSALALSPLVLAFGDDYVVRPGDTAGGIAAVHGVSVEALVEANALQRGGDLIYAGETLTIPSAHPLPSSGPAQRSTGRDGRRTVWHTVTAGDTVSDLAVRYHAWTAEVVEVNDLNRTADLLVGQRLLIPVVRTALPHAANRDPQRPTSSHRRASATDPSRAHVRRVIVHTARAYGVDPVLALAVSWQEAGWQQDHLSSAGARGAMQVMPSTGVWIETLIDRELDLRSLSDNVTAGVVLLHELTQATSQRRALAGYYQGLASVADNGMYRDTRAYVANVLAIKAALEAGNGPN